jgi:hypothetical protein
MVLATAFVVAVAASFGRASNDIEYRLERNYMAARTWDAAVSEADAKSAGGSFATLPQTFALSLNGFSGTISVTDNSASLANSLLVTSSLAAPDGTTYPESSIIAKSEYLNGNYWWTNGSSITTDLNAWSWMMSNPTPTGTFDGELLNYTGTDSSSIESWLSTDTSTYSGTGDNLEDGVVQLFGYITIPTNNTVLQDTSDDGSYVSVDGDRWVINNDGAHSATAETVTIPTAGFYPIFVTYFNHSSGGSGHASLKLYWDSSGQQTGSYTAIPISDLQTPQSWRFNGNAAAYGNGSELVNGTARVSGSAWLDTPQTISSFHTAFDFEFANPSSSGFTFCLQNTGLSALGNDSSGLGYSGISSSFCLKFEIRNGEDDTGVYTGGATPSNPTYSMSSSNVTLSSGDLMHCVLSYSGTTLNMTLTDQITGKSYSNNFTVNIPSAVGANTAYVGFTGATSNSVCEAYVMNFNFGP